MFESQEKRKKFSTRDLVKSVTQGISLDDIAGSAASGAHSTLKMSIGELKAYAAAKKREGDYNPAGANSGDKTPEVVYARHTPMPLSAIVDDSLLPSPQELLPMDDASDSQEPQRAYEIGKQLEGIVAKFEDMPSPRRRKGKLVAAAVLAALISWAGVSSVHAFVPSARNYLGREALGPVGSAVEYTSGLFGRAAGYFRK